MDHLFKLVCRVCLTKDPTSVMFPLADERTRELLFQCTSVWSQPGDGFPQYMCAKCQNQCISWFSFKTLALESDRKLKTNSVPDETAAIKEQLRWATEYTDGLTFPPVKEEFSPAASVPIIAQTVAAAVVASSVGHNSAASQFVVGGAGGVHSQSRSPNKPVKEKQKRGNSEKPSSIDWKNILDHQSTTTAQPTIPAVLGEFRCMHCNKAFTKASTLRNHERTHSGDRPHKCCFCDKAFNRKSNLEAHERIHTGEKPFPCRICGKLFSRKNNAAQHMRTHRDRQE